MPLTFTPVLGILVGGVLTLLLVAFVVILILRVKYKGHNRRRSSASARRIDAGTIKRNDSKSEKSDRNRPGIDKANSRECFVVTSEPVMHEAIIKNGNKLKSKSTKTSPGENALLEKSSLNNKMGQKSPENETALMISRDRDNPDVIPSDNFVGPFNGPSPSQQRSSTGKSFGLKVTLQVSPTVKDASESQKGES